MRAVTSELEALGFVAQTPADLRDALERHRAWERFMELMEAGDSLDARFEPSVYAPPTPEVVALRELAAEGVIASPTLLFIEVVYQTEGSCTVDSREHNRFATVVDRAGRELDRVRNGACVVTHIQAKLVDSKSASTIWHNRVLRELRVDAVKAGDDRMNVRATSADVVAGAYGLAHFAPGSGTAKP